MASVARVVVDLSLDKVFDYGIPPPLREAIRVGTPVHVPFGRSRREGIVIALADASSVPGLKDLIGRAGKEDLLTEPLVELAHWMAEYYAAPLEACIRTLLPGAVRRRRVRHREQLIALPADPPPGAEDEDALRRRAPKQAAALDALREKGPAPVAELARRAGSTIATLRGLERKGFLRIVPNVLLRKPHAFLEVLPTQPATLMEQQRAALDAILAAAAGEASRTILLYGVTGSGKTEVYMQAIREIVDRGGDAIVLVPEISLTPQTVGRFRARFGEEIAVLHSGLSEGERHDEWFRIARGAARIVVGARSAVFAPVRNLQLIVVDEEHETSYKQEESPRYHARDMAVVRAAKEGAVALLGSATPSLESLANVRAGKYRRVDMPHRVDHRSMPAICVVDMRQEAEKQGRPGIFSGALIEAIRNRLERAEQTILFLNRRGYASTLICPSCGTVAECPNCSVSMTVHKAKGRLCCHLCGEERAIPDRCPKPGCGDPAFKYSGMGTERIEEILGKLFPGASVERVDSDAMRTKNAYDRVMGAFRTGKIDILIGTQMIAKGLHFPNVTLVGVIFADMALHLPDFRAGERTFQLLTQVAGRAGRGDVKGEVIVQSYTPFHPAIQAARRMDYDGFCDQELEFRRELGYPPFTHLLCATFRGPVEQEALLTARALRHTVREELEPLGVLSEPSPAPIARIQSEYRYQLMFRTRKIRAASAVFRKVLREFPCPERVKVALDVDAMSLL
jgi:primosomal protein N' (replication factor Y) (superfamily II helicase)